jgi:GntR family transcriptional repressor for pyruvate dehydrogenase complex
MTNITVDEPVAERSEGSTEQVVSHVRTLIEQGELRPGGRLPAERDLATQIGVSRPTVRAGLRALAAMGVVRSRHGSGTYIPDGPPTLGSEPLSFLAALHGFTRDEMHETRRILEVGAAGLAAERATPDEIATLAEEVASLFATMHDPQAFLVHDINFHRAVAAASGNPVVASLVEMVSALDCKRRRETAGQAADRDLREAAEMHRRIYHAIRAHEAPAARAAMDEHLRQASAHQAQEAGAEPVPARPSRGPSGGSDALGEASGGRTRLRGTSKSASGARPVTTARRPRT